jgi:hypothetical protein
MEFLEAAEDRGGRIGRRRPPLVDRQSAPIKANEVRKGPAGIDADARLHRA